MKEIFKIYLAAKEGEKVGMNTPFLCYNNFLRSDVFEKLPKTGSLTTRCCYYR